MKTKKFDKKLILNKKTVAHLGNSQLDAVKGGIIGNYVAGPLKTLFTCPQTGIPCAGCAYPTG